MTMFIGIYLWAALVSTEFRSVNCLPFITSLSSSITWKWGLIGFDRQIDRDLNILDGLKQESIAQLNPSIQWKLVPLGGGTSPATVEWHDGMPTIVAQFHGFSTESAIAARRKAYIETLIQVKTPWGKAYRKLADDYYQDKSFWNSWSWRKKLKDPKARAAALLYRVHRLSFIHPHYKKIWDTFSRALLEGNSRAAKDFIYDVYEVEPGLNIFDLEIEIQSFFIHPLI